MAQTKYKLPPDVRKICENLVKGYKRRVTQYNQKRADILYASSYNDGMPRGSATGDSTTDKATRLELLEQDTETQRMRAVEQAKIQIGADIPAEEIRQRLMTAIWESTMDPRQLPYEVWDLPTIWRDDFYERKRKFMFDIAKHQKYL